MGLIVLVDDGAESGVDSGERTMQAREEVLEVGVVGIKLVPLPSNEMVSGGKDVLVKLDFGSQLYFVLFFFFSLFSMLKFRSMRSRSTRLATLVKKRLNLKLKRLMNCL